MKRFLKKATRALGFDIVRYKTGQAFEAPHPGPPDFEKLDLSDDDNFVLQRVEGQTMTSIARQISLVQAVRYLSRRGIEGCIVECGVWRGGSSMAVALTLIQEEDAGRNIYLYDTFEGMTAPTNADRTADGTSAQSLLAQDVEKTSADWGVANIECARQNMASTGYAPSLIHFVQGPVETTIPTQAPAGPIALLRLDTDWYESTRHELIHLFPRLVDRGVLIIDDYGHWTGAKKAVDEYLSSLPERYFMHRIDYTGRLIIKH
jgi:O-methyltransferase